MRTIYIMCHVEITKKHSTDDDTHSVKIVTKLPVGEKYYTFSFAKKDNFLNFAAYKNKQT